MIWPSGYQTFQTANDITRLIDNIEGICPGVVAQVVDMVIWNVIEDFFIKSTYRREHVYWQLEPGEIILDFDPYTAGGPPQHLAQDDPATDQCAENLNTWRVCRFMGFQGMTYPKFIPPGRVIDLTNPVPQTVRVGEAWLALKPDNVDVALPYDVWTTYWEVLLNGCMHKLYLQPGKPYSDLNAGNVYGRLYRSGIASARADAQAHHLREGTSWNYPYYAVGGRPSGRQGL